MSFVFGAAGERVRKVLKRTSALDPDAVPHDALNDNAQNNAWHSSFEPDVDTADVNFLSVILRHDGVLKAEKNLDRARYYDLPAFVPKAELSFHLAQGHIRAEFKDKLHQCPGCLSNRVNVREECPSCRSAHVATVPLLHHYRCAYVGPETDFRHGEDLVCPKCRGTLLHYGSDYDRAGDAQMCGSCHEVHDAPVVGFECHDCGAHTDGEAMPVEMVFDYHITEAGRAHAAQFFDTHVAVQTEMAKHLPLMVLAQLEAMKKIASSSILLEIRYANRFLISSQFGDPAFQTQRQQFISGLQTLLKNKARFASTPDADYLIFANQNEARLLKLAPDFIKYGQRSLRDDLGALCTVMVLALTSLEAAE